MLVCPDVIRMVLPAAERRVVLYQLRHNISFDNFG